jgi:hypothetical protein
MDTFFLATVKGDIPNVNEYVSLKRYLPYIEYVGSTF